MDKRAFTLAMAYVGCVAGAGFASGKEILTFFNGPAAVVMMALASVLFYYLGYTVMVLSERLGARNYRELIGLLFPGKAASVINVMLLTAFIVITASMIAATEHVFESMGMGLVPTLIIVVMCAVIASGGISWVAGSGVIVMLAFAAINLFLLGMVVTLGRFEFAIGSTAQSSFPVFRAFSYTGFNTIMSLGVLCGTGRNRKESHACAAISAVGIFILLLLLWLCMLPYLQEAEQKAMPMLHVAQEIGGPANYLLIAAMLLGIISTLVAQLHSARGYFEGKNKAVVISFLTLTAAAIAQIGFAGIVDMLYPVLGLLSAIVFARVIFVYYRGLKNASAMHGHSRIRYRGNNSIGIKGNGLGESQS